VAEHGVIHLEVVHGAAEGGDAPVRLRRPEGFCAHRHSELDGASRRVYCRDCGVEVDPFTVLEKLANDYESFRVARDRMKADAKRASQELEGVKRELRNAKARLRRAQA
jgi:hypothetical protein